MLWAVLASRDGINAIKRKKIVAEIWTGIGSGYGKFPKKGEWLGGVGQATILELAPRVGMPSIGAVGGGQSQWESHDSFSLRRVAGDALKCCDCGLL